MPGRANAAKGSQKTLSFLAREYTTYLLTILTAFEDCVRYVAVDDDEKHSAASFQAHRQNISARAH